MTWDKLHEKWQKLIPPQPQDQRFTSVDSLVVLLEDMTAQEYVESDRLDLDNLSSA